MMFASNLIMCFKSGKQYKLLCCVVDIFKARGFILRLAYLKILGTEVIQGRPVIKLEPISRLRVLFLLIGMKFSITLSKQILLGRSAGAI
jgi:hypothetical protein